MSASAAMTARAPPLRVLLGFIVRFLSLRTRACPTWTGSGRGPWLGRLPDGATTVCTGDPVRLRRGARRDRSRRGGKERCSPRSGKAKRSIGGVLLGPPPSDVGHPTPLPHPPQ